MFKTKTIHYNTGGPTKSKSKSSQIQEGMNIDYIDFTFFILWCFQIDWTQRRTICI